MSPKAWLFAFVLAFAAVPAQADEFAFPVRAQRVLFLGDSITNDGHYIALVDAQLRLSGNEHVPALINLGLPSETCSGLSEPEHPFPRPNVHERIDRALSKIKPDVVVACYGMNDAIYYPLSEERFEAYRQGVNKLIEKVHAAGAKLVLMTPPAFDPLPLRKKGKLRKIGEDEYSWKTIYEDYDDVMEAYAGYVAEQADRVEMVIDLHTAVTNFTDAKRKADPDFTMSPDGVHLNHEGHAVLADVILEAWGFQSKVQPDAGLMSLITRRQKILHDAWLSEVGHLRPGVKAGLPLGEAQAEAEEAEKQIRARVKFQLDEPSRKDKEIHALHFPASTKSGELPLFADYFLWIPPGVEKLRGVIVHQHGCGAGACSAGLTAANDWHWRELARKWDCALLGSSYEARVGQCRQWCDPRNGSEQRFLQALDRFAETTGHSELSTVPWCLWGHSGGGFWASLMQTSHPDRIVAIWLQSGTAFTAWQSGQVATPQLSDAVYAIPVMGCPGFKEKNHERFRGAWDGLHEMLQAYRSHDAPIGIAADPRTGHECGDARYLAIAFFDECLTQRLPQAGDDAGKLRPVDQSQARLASLEDHQIGTADAFDGDLSQLAWLPSQAFADKWLEFVQQGYVNDSTAPRPPHSIKASDSSAGRWLSWTAEADFESGLQGFRIVRDGKTVARLPEKPLDRFGRAIFQSMSYSDTPELPIPQPRWLDVDAKPGQKATYQVYSINTAGLESDPAEALVIQ